MRCVCNALSPPTHPLFFCRKLRGHSAHSYWSTAARVSRTGGPFPLVDRRRQPVARFYWSPDREDDSDEGSRRYSYPVSRAYKRQILPFSYLVLNNEPSNGYHFRSFFHISPLKQYKNSFSTKSLKIQIILQLMLVD
jgi:hypothetical protein